MSSIEKIYQDLKQMPPHLQNEVVDFIEFLRYRNNKNLVQQKTADTNTFFTDLMAWREKNQSLLRFREFQQAIYIASTVWHEMHYGINTMTEGRKKQQITLLLHEVFGHFQALSYDKSCAEVHAEIRAVAKQNGRILPFADSQIAAIALRHEAVLVTRNTKDFENINNLQLINWFE
ncbi:MAG: VapC toxin family PIN domain ribonuclease [Gammaproteobacteria bacterium]|nr:MAG: VapC toxin family PIN domain ribonuclease [Gammaproteobacteria bacterium]